MNESILTNASLSYNGLMVQHFGLFLILFLSTHAFGQDERYYRQLLKGELPSMGLEIKEVIIDQFNIKGSSYLIDLNGDGIEETIQPQKRDGIDWIEIKNSSGGKVFEAKFLAMGGESSIYKVKLAQLSSTVKLLLFFVDEGSTFGRRFESTARTYLVTFENDDFSTLQMIPGPHHFHEREAQKDQYWRRDYSVEIRDVNQDGVRDVIVQFNHIQRIMIYKGKGEWKRY